MSRSLVVLLAMSVAACSEKQREPAPAPAPAPGAAAVAPADAGAQQAPIATPSGVQVDEDGAGRFVVPEPRPGREGKAIDVTLRSSPPGALVAVDGATLGNTPAYWNGLADGRVHQFVFTLRGYAVADYRFVPVSSGVIHARLDPITEETADAGVPSAQAVPPRRPPASMVTPPSPPPTVVQPARPPVGPQP